MAFEGGIHPGPWQISQARTVFAISDPRLRRPTLDPDFNRPNSVAVVLQFLRNSQLGFLSEDANANLDEPATPAYCAKNSPDPALRGFPPEYHRKRWDERNLSRDEQYSIASLVRRMSFSTDFSASGGPRSIFPNVSVGL